MNTESCEDDILARQPSVPHQQNPQGSHIFLRGCEAPIGAQFEKFRRWATDDLKAFIKLQGPKPGGLCLARNHEPGAITNADDSDTEDIEFEFTRDHLRAELRIMMALLQRIQEDEWPYRSFPYVPQCLLYFCGFGLASALSRTPTSIRENTELSRLSQPTAGRPAIVWRATGDVVMLLTPAAIIRVLLLFGFGSCGIWTVYRALRFGIMAWCKYSLKKLIRAVDRNYLEDGSQHSLSGVQFSLMWWINMLTVMF